MAVTTNAKSQLSKFCRRSYPK